MTTFREAHLRFADLHIPEPNSGCWLWIGHVDMHGYGKFRNEGRILTASRASWELHRGKITSRQWVLHKCDNSVCVNPEHLYLGDRAANVHDAVSRGRLWSRGTVLCEADVHRIRRLLEAGMAQAEIAEQFGVTIYTIRNIKSGRTWSHLARAA